MLPDLDAEADVVKSLLGEMRYSLENTPLNIWHDFCVVSQANPA